MTTRNWNEMTVEQLDEEACYLAKRMDSLVLFGATGNLDSLEWFDKKAFSEFKKLRKQLADIDNLLENLHGPQ